MPHQISISLNTWTSRIHPLTKIKPQNPWKSLFPRISAVFYYVKIKNPWFVCFWPDCAAFAVLWLRSVGFSPWLRWILFPLPLKYGDVRLPVRTEARSPDALFPSGLPAVYRYAPAASLTLRFPPAWPHCCRRQNRPGWNHLPLRSASLKRPALWRSAWSPSPFPRSSPKRLPALPQTAHSPAPASASAASSTSC